MVQQIGLGKVILITGIVVATLIYMGINSGIFWQDAEGAMCGKTCQAATDKGMTVGEYREWQKTGKEPSKKSSTSTTSKTVKKENCYGIYCDRVNDNDIDLEEQWEDWYDLQRSRNFISIQISKSCQISGTCPTYKELAEMYDNSDKYLSGDFYFNNQTGLWERGEPPIFNSFEYYRFMNLPWIVFVDPDDYTWDRSKQIVIHSELVYLDPRDTFKNQILTHYVGLKMDGCSSAQIGWNNNGSDILIDVLNYFYTKCRGSLNYDPEVNVFINSTIFPDCDRECFHYKDVLKREIKLDQILVLEAYDKANCDDETENDYTGKTNYEQNKAECDRITFALGEEVDDDDDEPCYGIYCDDKRKDKKEVKEKSTFELRQERLRELEVIQDCKEDQIWDEERKNGSYRRLLFDCDDDDEREEYNEIILCESVGYDHLRNEDNDEYDCYDEDERDDKLKRMEVQIEVENPDLLDQLECESFKKYELTTDDFDKVGRASIVSCEDAYEREEYLQYTDLVYPDGVPN